MPRNFTNFFEAFGIPEANRNPAAKKAAFEVVSSKPHAVDYYSRKQLKHARNAVLSAELLVFAVVLAVLMVGFGW